MRSRWAGPALFLATAVLCISGGEVGAARAAGDVRDLSVGMAAVDLPSEGYLDFACASGTGDGRGLLHWTDFAACAPGADGLHEVTFHYDDSTQPFAAVNDRWSGTKIGGHPVVLSLLFDEAGTVTAIRATTDPAAPPFARRQAFLLGARVMIHYGDEGWSCTDGQPRPGRAPVGAVFVDRHCEKTADHRHVLVDTAFYRTGSGPRDLVNQTRFEIREAPG